VAREVLTKEVGEMNLSKVQQGVIDKMNDDWELGCYTMGGCTLQKGGLGKGGEAERVSHATVTSLYQKRFIRQIYGFPAIRYVLIKEGDENKGTY